VSPEPAIRSGNDGKAAVVAGYRQVAPGWHRLRREFSVAGAEVTAELLAAARIRPGMAVLDIACGAGEPALKIAPLAGRVVAVDLVADMLPRRPADGVLAFCVADAEALPVRAAAFDRVTCRMAIMHFPDPARAVAEAFRALRPGGRYAVVAQGPAVESPAINATIAVLLRHGARPRTVVPAGSDLYRFGTSGALESLLTAAGFTEVRERHLMARTTWPGDAAQFWHAVPEHGFGVADLLRSLSPDAQRRARAEAVALLREYEDGDALHLPTPIVVADGLREPPGQSGR
jgi:ubiquinone/menaquinone biosynthesis C-methylase UbiE